MERGIDEENELWLEAKNWDEEGRSGGHLEDENCHSRNVTAFWDPREKNSTDDDVVCAVKNVISFKPPQPSTASFFLIP